MQRSFKGIWIPKEIWEDEKLTVMEKLFLVEIDSLDNADGCFASNKHFSNFFKISKGRCSQIIKSLEAKNLITIQIIQKDRVIKSRVLRVVNKLNRGIKNIKQGYLENAAYNNTSIYITTTTKKIAQNVGLLEIYAMQLRQPKTVIESKIEEFVKFCSGIKKQHDNDTDLFNHFGMWLRKQDFTAETDQKNIDWFIQMFNRISGGEYIATDEVKKLFAKQLANGFTGSQMEKAVRNLYSKKDINRFHRDKGFQFATPVHLLKEDNVNKYLNQEVR